MVPEEGERWGGLGGESEGIRKEEECLFKTKAVNERGGDTLRHSKVDTFPTASHS